MSAIDILIVATERDLVTAGLVNAVTAREDMHLACERVLVPTEVGDALSGLDGGDPCAILLVGKSAECDALAECWLRDHENIVIVRATLADDLVHFDARGIGLDALLATAQELARRGGKRSSDRVACILVQSAGHVERPLLRAALEWIHAMFCAAVACHDGGGDGIPGLALSAASLQRQLDGTPGDGSPEAARRIAGCTDRLVAALAAADPVTEPLAGLYHRPGLDLLEWKMLLLALAPECDPRYQQCIGFLLDDLSRRSGSLALYAAMLGDPVDVRCLLARRGSLLRWRLLDAGAGFPGLHEPFQLDPCVVDWVFGTPAALGSDPRLRRSLRVVPWPGATLLRSTVDRTAAVNLARMLVHGGRGPALLLGGPDLVGWRALLEQAARGADRELLRLELPRLPADPVEATEAALRAARCACLEGHLLVLDAQVPDGDLPAADVLQAVLAAWGGMPCRVAIVTAEIDHVLAALGDGHVQLAERVAPDHTARAALVQAAATPRLVLGRQEAEVLGHAFPLPLDALARAGRLAAARARAGDSPERLREQFAAACRSTASQRLSRLAHRITPCVRLTDVVLPDERCNQLHEIVSNVRLGPKVYDEWRFGERLPYGRGVAALFYGPSGTGKSMAAHAVAHELGIDLFSLDLSRVVSKYIGETERNIDAVFADAERCGAAVLIDEADALLGKRSEVKDAHDRYANIEVAYLLQRMESFTGLAILTSNIRHNLDQAFLRRLRFVIEFPRPDTRARAAIWRLCLPAATHVLGERELALLARQAELTGGHIRQISLRAAFAAAAAGTRIDIDHLQHAANAELAKLGLPGIDLHLSEAA